MIDILIQTGLSNAVVSLTIAIVAFIVGKFAKMPRLAHMLWLLVLIKLLMPSLLTLPVLPETYPTSNAVQVAALNREMSKVGSKNTAPSQVIETSSSLFSKIFLADLARNYLPILWGFGILVVLGDSFIRVFRFNRLLKLSSETAPQTIYKTAKEVADKISLRKLPLIRTTTAEISPMVWWIGGKVQIFIPHVLIAKLEPEKLRLVLAHELAHVRRRDYLVRWVEWSAAVLFWWNPVVWWAQRNLRANEEICCDALILSSLKPAPEEYAASLLSAVENFAEPAYRPPSMASEVNSGGYLIRRIHMILSNENNRTLSGKMQILVLFIAALVLPLGLITAQDKSSEGELKKAHAQLKEDVKAGRISEKQAKAKLAELKHKIELHHASKKLHKAVKSGKLSAKEAEHKLHAYKRHQKTKVETHKLKRAAEKLKSEHKEGKISEKELEKEIHKLKLEYEQTKHTEYLRNASEKLKYAVEKKKLSPDAAKKKLEALEHQYARAQKLHFENQDKIHEVKNAYRKNVLKVQKAAEKIKEEIKAGKISEKDAHVKLEKLHQKHTVFTEKLHRQATIDKIKANVKAGKISKKDAKKKIDALKKEVKEKNRQ